MIRKNKFLITFNNTYPKLINVFPEPESATKHIPEWYKKQPAYFDNDRSVYNGTQKLTVKKCTAFFDVISSGYMFLAPCDIFIDTTVSPPVFDIPQQLKTLTNPLLGAHSAEQVSHYPLDLDNNINTILRINMVWVASTSPGTSCLFIDPQHKDKSPLKAISAIIDTDLFYSDGNFSFIVEKNFKGVIKRGTPLVQIVPFKRYDWQHNINNNFSVAKDLTPQRIKVRSIFNGGYKKYFWNKKEYK